MGYFQANGYQLLRFTISARTEHDDENACIRSRCKNLPTMKQLA
jgi:hypothetical protein